MTHLPRLVPALPGRPQVAGPDHPMRTVTREVAFDGGWSRGRAAKVAALFDELAPTWGERDAVHRHDALRDALDRGGPWPRGAWLEIGAGTGMATRTLVARATGPVVALDLSAEMLRQGRAGAPRVRGDAARTPVRSLGAAAIVLVNMFLFPDEVDRVLQPDGALIWVNTLGDATPIHLPADDVHAALPGRWEGVASEAGWGTWVVLRRAR